MRSFLSPKINIIEQLPHCSFWHPETDRLNIGSSVAMGSSYRQLQVQIPFFFSKLK
uniref:Uncharacterized protein n=1 Tax=Anopheles albimanus TaxID=7167 RepID=A0A182FY43_ANOAL